MPQLPVVASAHARAVSCSCGPTMSQQAEALVTMSLRAALRSSKEIDVREADVPKPRLSNADVGRPVGGLDHRQAREGGRIPSAARERAQPAPLSRLEGELAVGLNEELREGLHRGRHVSMFDGHHHAGRRRAHAGRDRRPHRVESGREVRVGFELKPLAQQLRCARNPVVNVSMAEDQRERRGGRVFECRR